MVTGMAVVETDTAQEHETMPGIISAEWNYAVGYGYSRSFSLSDLLLFFSF